MNLGDIADSELSSILAEDTLCETMRHHTPQIEQAFRGRALPGLAVGLAAMLGVQVGVAAAQSPTRADQNAAIIVIASAPAPLSVLDTNSLLIWTAATLAVLLLLSRRSRTCAALLISTLSRTCIPSRVFAHRQTKAGISYRTGGLYGP